MRTTQQVFIQPMKQKQSTANEEVIKRNKEMIEKITSKYSNAGQQDNIN